MLEAPLRESEILNALKSFKPMKAPGPDGLHPLFFQKYWDIVGQKTIDLCRHAFARSTIDPAVNATLLCLIPKCPNATTLKKFRPIGLCNTSYKLVTKIIADRIRDLLPHIISLNQASFIKGRRSSDNAIIVRSMSVISEK